MIIKQREFPVCGESDSIALFNQKFSGIDGIKFPISHYTVCKCILCGMIYANGIPSQEEVDNYYFSNNKYEYNDANHKESNNYSNLYYDKIVDYICSYYSIDTLIADVGCGSGSLLTTLRSKGYNNLVGYDTSLYNVDTLNKNGIRAYNEGIFQLREIGDKFDIIILCAVLEHLVDVKGAIGRIEKMLKDNGKIIIVVPDIANANGSKYPFQEFSSEHINYFTYNSLLSLMYKLDFNPVVQLNTDSLAIVFKRRLMDEFSIYIDLSKQAISNILKSIEELLANQVPVTVWGVGSLTRHLLANTIFNKLNISAFIDRDKHFQGKTIDGKRILSPDEYRADSQLTDIPVIISSYNATESIKMTIREDFNLNNQIITLIN
jgi:2-polyprenyl-3-methyl-5-hydroxy-6-metoxy-1,4-benzoquinol methylase